MINPRKIVFLKQKKIENYIVIFKTKLKMKMMKKMKVIYKYGQEPEQDQ